MGPSTPGVSPRAEQRGRSTCPNLLVMLCLAQPVVLLATSSARAHCCLTFNLSHRHCANGGPTVLCVAHLMLTLTFLLINTPSVIVENSSPGYVIRLHWLWGLWYRCSYVYLSACAPLYRGEEQALLELGLANLIYARLVWITPEKCLFFASYIIKENQGDWFTSRKQYS